MDHVFGLAPWTMAEGFVALEAGRVAATGASIQEVAAAARGLAPRTWLFATVASFEFLRRSGRVTKLQAYAATMLDVKPVFRFREGTPEAIGRPRTRRRALDRVVEESLAAIAGRPVHLAGLHADAEDDARSLVARISEQANVVESIDHHWPFDLWQMALLVEQAGAFRNVDQRAHRVD